MAIQFDPKALSAFSNVDFRQADAITNLGENGGLVQNGTRGHGVFAKFRGKDIVAKNNAVRTELLKALGQAFSLNGVNEQGGKTTFSPEFMDRLEKILGPAFKRGDFGIKNGTVASGKPLTQRRITAICNAALAKAKMPYDGKAYSAKIDSIMGRFSGKKMDPHSVIKVREYALTIRKTIEFLENDMGGFNEACANRSLDEVKDFVFKHTRLTIFPEDITRALGQKGFAAPGNPPVDQVKNYIRERLETMVKTTVDLCLEAKKLEDCVNIIDVIYRNYYRMEDALLALGKITQPNPGQ